MNSTLSLMVSLVVFVGVLWLFGHEIRQNQPPYPPEDRFRRWKSDQFVWRRSGLR